MSETPQERAQLYKLLSECYLAPDDAWLERLKDCARSADGLRAGVAAALSPAEDLPRLRVDHAKLFVGPFRLLAPPYGSVYLEHTKRVMGETTVDAQAFYASEGLEPAFMEPPDHIATELEFMHYLVAKEAEALAVGDENGAAEYRGKQADFMVAHLGLWAPRFAAEVEANAETEFYRSAGAATGAFVKDELACLTGTLNPASS